MQEMLSQACGMEVVIQDIDYQLIGDTFWLKCSNPQEAQEVVNNLLTAGHSRAQLVGERKLGQKSGVPKRQVSYKGQYVPGAATLFLGKLSGHASHPYLA
eukprot:7159015-Karenia_brevis.AAC.1